MTTPASFGGSQRNATGGPVTTVVPVLDDSSIGEARRAATSLVDGVDENVVGRIAIVASELATNLARHARDGALFLRRIGPDEGHPGALELVAADRGPGMADVSECLRDGFSTGGTSGVGLGAISRMTEGFDIYSRPGKGTIVVCRVPVASWPENHFVDQRMVLGATCIPYPGERVCGDGWVTHARPDGKFLMMLVDGLGHGPQAAFAADTAVAAFRYALQRSATPAELIHATHGALRPTRGAAVAIAEIDPIAHVVHFTGVGNITATILSEQNQNLVSHNGIVGHQMSRVREFSYAWPVGATLVMHTDGLLSRWTFDEHPGLLSRHPSMLTTVLYREHTRGRDDATVLATRDIADHQGFYG